MTNKIREQYYYTHFLKRLKYTEAMLIFLLKILLQMINGTWSNAELIECYGNMPIWEMSNHNPTL